MAPFYVEGMNNSDDKGDLVIPLTMLFFCVVVVVAIGLWFFVPWNAMTQQTQNTQQPNDVFLDDVKIEIPISVTLTFVLDDQTTVFPPLDLNEGDTVLTALLEARELHDLAFESEGSGNMTFVTSMLGQANEGANGRNWVYLLNGEKAKKGVGSLTLSNGDAILWEFARSE